MDPVKTCGTCTHRTEPAHREPCRGCNSFNDRWTEAARRVRASREPKGNTPIASDGGSSGYYVLPADATELRHLIQSRKMNFSIGNIFKACWRLGLKAGTEKYYDLRKMVFFVLDEYEADGREVYRAELTKLRNHIDKELARLG